MLHFLLNSCIFVISHSQAKQPLFVTRRARPNIGDELAQEIVRNDQNVSSYFAN